MKNMKIVSLLPSATEIVYALGLGDHLAAVTHECDYPREARQKPVITRSLLPPGLSSGAIDQAVRGQLDQSHSLYTIDRALLSEIKPDLILTQQLCDVCAVSYGDVLAAAHSLPEPSPHILNLEPNSLEDVLDTVRLVGMATGRDAEADEVLAGLRGRIAEVRRRVGQARTRPRTILLEWIEPLFGGGHWNPEMVEIAGGVDTVGRGHKPSTRVSWETIRDFAPEVLVVAQCGFGVERSALDMPLLEALPGYADLPAVRAGRVYVVNGSDYFSRPGPRLVDSLEMLATLLHPQLFGPLQTSPAQVVQWHYHPPEFQAPKS